MSVLRLQLNNDQADFPSAWLPAQVVDTELNTVRRLPVQLGRTSEMSIDPGQYQVRINLPSGRTLSTHTSVKPNEVAIVNLRSPFRGASKWLARRKFLGSVDLDDSLRDIKRFSSTWLRLWTFEPERGWSSAAPGVRNEQRHEQAVLLTLQLPKGGRKLHALQVGGPQLPWRVFMLPPEKDPSVLLYLWQAKRCNAEDLKVDVMSNAFDAESLMRYRQHGDLISARLLGENLINRLWGAESGATASSSTSGLENPTTALVALYHGVEAGLEEQISGWAAQLARLWPWLPDLSILRGWSSLVCEGAASEEAADHLKKAARQGVPLFTEGLRLLTDGLWKCRESRRSGEDQEMEEAFAAARYLTAVVDWKRPQTTFGGKSPDQPSTDPIVGTPDPRTDLIYPIH